MKKLVMIASIALLFASCGTSTEAAGKCIETVDSTSCCAADSAKALVNYVKAEDSLK